MIPEEKYCRKLISMVYNKQYTSETYNNLFMDLYSRDFTWTIPGDANRAADGLKLRERLGFNDILQEKPCSILEMLVALANRIETDLMYNPEEGDRTAQWFWEMIVNMNLGSQSDRNYDPAYVNSCVEIFIRREYDADGGNGGIFVLDNPRNDLRKTEIWYQAMWYLVEIGSY
jgi:hypothetical protein